MSTPQGTSFSFDDTGGATTLFERILVPLDGSPAAESILYQAQRLLCGRKSQVILFHARISDPPSPGSDVAAKNPAAYLKSVADRLTYQGARDVRTSLHSGPVRDALREAIQVERASLVAISSHGARTAPSVPLADAVDEVLRDTTVPLFVSRAFEAVSPDEVRPARCEPSNIRRILVPLDGSSVCEAILPFARELGQMLKALIVVLYVDPEMAEGPGEFLGTRVTGRPEGPTPGEAASADDRLAYAARFFSAVGLETMVMKLGGSPAATILGFARPSAVDLIAMTTHGRTGISKLLIGSVAQKVLREAFLPTLVVRGLRAATDQCVP